MSIAIFVRSFRILHKTMLSQKYEKYNLIHAILAEIALIILGLALYALFPFFQFYFIGWDNFGLSKGSFLLENGLYYLALVYALLLPMVMYRFHKEGRKPKSLVVINKLIHKTVDKEFWFCIRIFILKFFYIPLMYLGAIYFGEIAISHLLGFNAQIKSWSWVAFINNYLFPCFIYVVMTAVLIVYTFGYCVESDLLDNRIKSIDDNPFSWMVTIVCYVPFYPLLFYIIPMGAQDFAFFKSHEITAVVRSLLMVIIAAKAWSIFTLGTKSSNLTNRGIITNGPYRWVRHPHYLTKMMVWWICVLPSLVQNYWLIGGMIFWTTIYVLRALTEEQHLKRDPDYVVYMQKVKWRFIPGFY